MFSSFMDFDMYSQKMGFFYKNKDKISSKFGIFLTIVYIIISLGLFIFYTVQTIKRTNIKVHDSTMYLKELSKLNIDQNLFYFAFGIEDPETSTRFIDETIYYPRVTFFEKIKEGSELTTIEERELEVERCKQEKFGDKYQSLIVEGELNNSYCINDINLTLSRGLKLDRISYIKIEIYPCVNNTKNNNYCKSKEIIDQHISGTFFSLLAKDIGLDPSNYSDPIIPTLQNMHTTIDKSFFRDFVLYFGITEVQTDVGLLLEDIHKESYINFIKSTQAFYNRDEKHYYNGETMCEIQFKLGDDIRIQKRSFMKMTEVFAITGGYMQLISTIFKIISLWSNKLNYEEKIINSLFNIYPEKKKVTLKKKLQNKLSYFYNNNNKTNNNKFNYAQNNSEISEINKNNKNSLNINDILFQSNNLDNNSNDITHIQQIQINKSNKNKIKENKNLIDEKSKEANKSKADLLNLGSNSNSINIINRMQKQSINNNNNSLASENEDNKSKKIKINLFYYCFPKCTNSTEEIKLFILSLSFYESKMDITHFFYISLLIEKLSKNKNLISNF